MDEKRSKLANQAVSARMIPFTPYEDYKDKYKSIFKMERSASGVLSAIWNNDGDSDYWDVHLHRGLHQLCTDVGQDLDTEVLIIGGAGDTFLKLGKTSLGDEQKNFHWVSYDCMYYDGCNMVEGLINDVEVPTIGIINGPAVHSEIALFCDITLMAEDAILFDPHWFSDMLPGDGVQIALRYYMGPKRANRAMLFNEKITAQKALEYGLITEIVPRDKLYDRAKEIGEQLAAKPRVQRRVMSHLMRYDLKQALAQELRFSFGTEMWVDFCNHKEIENATHEGSFEKINNEK